MATIVEDDLSYTADSVRSRISWAAILAGAAVAMAIYALLMSLGVAVGMSVDDDANSRNFGTSAGVWSFTGALVGPVELTVRRDTRHARDIRYDRDRQVPIA